SGCLTRTKPTIGLRCRGLDQPCARAFSIVQVPESRQPNETYEGCSCWIFTFHFARNYGPRPIIRGYYQTTRQRTEQPKQCSPGHSAAHSTTNTRTVGSCCACRSTAESRSGAAPSRSSRHSGWQHAQPGTK